jgi:DnaJ homolog subfamily C member 3
MTFAPGSFSTLFFDFFCGGCQADQSVDKKSAMRISNIRRRPSDAADTVLFWTTAVVLCSLSLESSSSSPRFLVRGALASDGGAASPGKLRSVAEEAMMNGDYTSAIENLNLAVSLEPDSPLNHFKLYRVYHRKRQYESALSHIATATDMDAAKYRPVKAKLLLQLAQCEQAVVEYSILLGEMTTSGDNDGSAAVIQMEAQTAQECQRTQEAATAAFVNQHYDVAVHHYTTIVSRFVELGSSTEYLYPKAVSLYHTGDYYGCISDTGRLLKENSNKPDVYKLRGDAYYALGEHDQAILHYREALKMDPEHKESKAGHKQVKAIEKKLKKGDAAFAAADYPAALEHWEAAIAVDPSHTAFVRPLTLKMAMAHAKNKQVKQGLAIVDGYLEQEETLEGLTVRAEIQQLADDYEGAVRTMERAVEIAPDDASRQTAQKKLQAAQVALKQSKEKNYYKILGLQRSADKKEIKRAYRDLALKWHPDKNTGDSKEEAEKMFHDIGEAYEVLSDDELKGKYDRGEQVFENQGGQQRQSPHQQFFHFQQGGGRQHSNGGQQFRFHF